MLQKFLALLNKNFYGEMLLQDRNNVCCKIFTRLS
jgi:hypothetical protein